MQAFKPSRSTDLDTSTYSFSRREIIYIEGVIHENFGVSDLWRLNCTDKSHLMHEHQEIDRCVK